MGRTIDYTKHPMPKQEPFERVRNFDEVALGYTNELAREEAGDPRLVAAQEPPFADLLVAEELPLAARTAHRQHL